MKKLIKGIADFRKHSIEEYRTKFSKLAKQQSPDALFIACCDSRVVPNAFASSDPGDLFVVRNIGNLVPPYQNNQPTDCSVSAAIEFSLTTLDVSDIIICGHSDCGAMHALMENEIQTNASSPLLNTWLKHAKLSYMRFKKTGFKGDREISACNYLSRINVLQQLDNLVTYPLVTEHLQSNKLKIHGWWFDLETANIYCYEPNQKKFILIDDEKAENILAVLENDKLKNHY